MYSSVSQRLFQPINVHMSGKVDNVERLIKYEIKSETAKGLPTVFKRNLISDPRLRILLDEGRSKDEQESTSLS